MKSGRLSVRAGNLAKWIGMKPIITLDKEGKGRIESIAFSIAGSYQKIKRHLCKIQVHHDIEQYNIVHVNNPKGALELAEFITYIIGIRPAYITETSSIVAVSAGNGAVAVSYLLKKKGGK
jgi:fatty acid-binding protein DegV